MGIWSDDFAAIPLTELGHQQAAEVAAAWEAAPTHIVVSGYLRARQTAAPTTARFPEVKAETWDVHEFTYWDIANWKGADLSEQPQEVERFWAEADPEYRQGESAESFTQLLARADATLRRLEALPADAVVVLFTHGHFIQAVRHRILKRELSNAQAMAGFRAFDEKCRVRNTQSVAAEFDGSRWKIECHTAV